MRTLTKILAIGTFGLIGFFERYAEIKKPKSSPEVGLFLIAHNNIRL